MNSSRRSQTILASRRYRPLEERRPAPEVARTRLLPERPSAAKASRKMLSHWPSKTGPVRRVRTAA